MFKRIVALPVGYMDDRYQPQKPARGQSNTAVSNREMDARIRVVGERERAKQAAK